MHQPASHEQPQAAISTEPRILGASELRETSKSLSDIIQKRDVVSLNAIRQDLIHTINSGKLAPAHGAACLDAISGFFEKCSSITEDHAVQKLALGSGIWQQLFQVLQHANRFKPKPARRLLTTLTLLVQRQSDDESRQECKQSVIDAAIDAIFGHGSASVRSLLHILEYFLNKHVIEISSILARAACTAAILISELLNWLSFPDCAPAVARFLPLFVTAHENSLASSVEEGSCQGADLPSVPNDLYTLAKEASSKPVWIDPVRRYCNSSHEHLELVENYILTGLLNLGPRHREGFMHELGLEDILQGRKKQSSDAEIEMCIMVVRGQFSQSSNSLFDPESLFLKVYASESASVRVLAFSLLTRTARSFNALGQEALVAVLKSLRYMHHETNPKVRNAFVAECKKLCQRLHRVASTRSGHATSHAACLSSYIKFLLRQLHSAAPYQSHIISLQMLLYMKQSGILTLMFASSPRHKRLFLSGFLMSLRNLLYDPFDDVRQISAAILQSLLDDEQQAQALMKDESEDQSISNNILAWARDDPLRSSGRADHAEGRGLLRMLTFSILKESASITALYQNLQLDIDAYTSSKRAPTTLQGNLIGLRYIICASSHHIVLETLLDPVIVDLSARLWEIVRPILCCDAPEGRKLDVDESMSEDMHSSELLSFCWRALKESSSVLDGLVSRFVKFPCCWTAPEASNIFKRLGQLTFEQLTSLRHRGAFSTVSQTFAAWCAASQMGPFTIVEMPKLYYRESLDCIFQQSSLTRRSAGLPSIIIGILSAFTEGPFFDEVILDLQAIADDTANEMSPSPNNAVPQVHALNCLRSIFTDARYGALSEPHMPDSLSIAVLSLNSHIWAVRNCGLMLISAIISRINGGTDTASSKASSARKTSSGYTYQRFPDLPGLILLMLDHDSRIDQAAVHKIFPAIEILRRFGLPHQHRQIFIDRIYFHLGSPFWLVRDKCAELLSSTSPKAQRLTHSTAAVQQGPMRLGHNAFHGNLLCLARLADECLSYEDVELVCTKLLPLTTSDQCLCHVTTIHLLRLVNSYIRELDHLEVANNIRGRARDYCKIYAECASELVHSKDKLISQSAQAFMHEITYKMSFSTPKEGHKRDRGQSPQQFDPLNLVSATACDPRHFTDLLHQVGAYAAKICDDQSLSTLTRWIAITSQDTSDIEIRSAAESSLSTFITHVDAETLRRIPSGYRIQLTFTMFDLINDDDSDVRFSANRTAQRYIAKLAADAECHRPEQSILDIQNALMASLGPDQVIWPSAYADLMSRILGQKMGLSSHGSSTGSIEHDLHRCKDTIRFHAASQDFSPPTTIFEEEKTNLYVDVIEEMTTLTELLYHHGSIIDGDSISKLASYLDATALVDQQINMLKIMSGSTRSPTTCDPSKAEIRLIDCYRALMVDEAHVAIFGTRDRHGDFIRACLQAGATLVEPVIWQQANTIAERIGIGNVET